MPPPHCRVPPAWSSGIGPIRCRLVMTGPRSGARLDVLELVAFVLGERSSAALVAAATRAVGVVQGGDEGGRADADRRAGDEVAGAARARFLALGVLDRLAFNGSADRIADRCVLGIGRFARHSSSLAK